MNAFDFHMDWWIVLVLGTQQSVALGCQCWNIYSNNMLFPDILSIGRYPHQMGKV